MGKKGYDMVVCVVLILSFNETLWYLIICVSYEKRRQPVKGATRGVILEVIWN
jgi:hypothetical protein